MRQIYKSDDGPKYPWGAPQRRHDHDPEARAGHREAPRRDRDRGPDRGSDRHELFRVLPTDHRQRDPPRGPEAVLRPPRRGPPPDILGDRRADGRPELA